MLGKETNYEKSTSKLQNFKVSLLRPYTKNEKLTLKENSNLLKKDLPQEESQQVGFWLSVARKVK